MDRLLVSGKYSGYSKGNGEDNIPIEKKRDVIEDASWYSLEKLSSFYDREFNTRIDPISDTHRASLHEQIGEPTNPIVKELLHAEYQIQVGNEIRRAYKKKSWIENITAPEVISFEHQPPILVPRKPFAKMTNEELLRIMFEPFKLVSYFKWFVNDYSGKLEKNFRDGNGMTLPHHLKKWPDKNKTNLNKLFEELKGKIHLAYWGGISQNVTSEIQKNWLDFSNASWRMIGESMAFGGIQEVELKGYLSQIKHAGKGDQFDKFGNVFHDSTILEIRFEFIIKDWFGVDEEDVYKNSYATKLIRDSLAAFWVLQHQRGYRPFINVITYTETKEYIF